MDPFDILIYAVIIPNTFDFSISLPKLTQRLIFDKDTIDGSRGIRTAPRLINNFQIFFPTYRFEASDRSIKKSVPLKKKK